MQFTLALHPDLGVLVEQEVITPSTVLLIVHAVNVGAGVLARAPMGVLVLAVRVTGVEEAVASMPSSKLRLMIEGVRSCAERGTHYSCVGAGTARRMRAVAVASDVRTHQHQAAVGGPRAFLAGLG